MKRVLLAGTGLFALAMAAQPAAAADMPARVAKAPAMVAAPMFDWSGFYVGVNAGYGWGDTHHDFAGGTHGDFDVDGWLAGGTIGVNWQTGQWVFGLEGDYAWASIEGSKTADCDVRCTSDLRHLGTARVRLGHAWGQWLGYLTGGVAFGSIHASEAANSDKDDRVGWTAGVGIEGAIGSNWSVKLEYLYVDLGSDRSYTNEIPHDVSFDAHIVRAGLNYRFATGKAPGAVMTRY